MPLRQRDLVRSVCIPTACALRSRYWMLGFRFGRNGAVDPGQRWLLLFAQSGTRDESAEGRSFAWKAVLRLRGKRFSEVRLVSRPTRSNSTLIAFESRN